MSETQEPRDFGLPPKPGIIPDVFPLLDPENEPTDQWLINEAIVDEDIDHDLLWGIQARDHLDKGFREELISSEEYKSAQTWVSDYLNTVQTEKDIPRP